MGKARLSLSDVFALLLLCCSLASVANAQSSVNMSAICGLVPNGALIADPGNCAGYYSCSNGIASNQNCNSNYYFSKNSQACVPQSQVNCITNTNSSAPCNGVTVGSWVGMVGNCNGFYYCSDSGPLAGYCPTGENFNPTAQSCQYPTTYQCSNSGSGDSLDSGSINFCDYVQDGIYFGSPSSCQGWNICENGALTSGNCPTGYNYNVQKSGCISSSATTCPQLSSDPDVAPNDPYYGGACTTSGTQQAASTCQNYYVCNGVNYILTTCSKGYYYDTVSGTCVNRLDARNDCNRCQGTTQSFVNVYSDTDCTGYAYCQNGVATSTGTCPSGSYFNEANGACVMGDEPNFGCCNPAYVGSTDPTD